MSKILYEVPAPEGLTINKYSGDYKIKKVSNASLFKDATTQVSPLQPVTEFDLFQSTDSYKRWVTKDSLIQHSAARKLSNIEELNEEKKAILQNLNRKLVPIQEITSEDSEKNFIVEYDPGYQYTTKESSERKTNLEKIDNKKDEKIFKNFLIENEIYYQKIPKRIRLITNQKRFDKSLEINLQNDKQNGHSSNINQSLKLRNSNDEVINDINDNPKDMNQIELEDNKIDKIKNKSANIVMNQFRVYKSHSLLLLWITLLVLFVLLIQAIVFSISFNSCTF